MIRGARHTITWILPLILAGICHGQALEPFALRYPRPAWLDEGPIVAGMQSCDAILMTTRSGREPRTWFKEDYAFWKSEEQVRQWKEQGFTLMILNFYRGFGLEAEKQQIEDTIRQAEYCRKHGIRVGVYVVDTISYETFLLEKPEAAEWLVPDFRGAPVIYGGTECFRRRPYIGHPGYIEYVKEVLRIAVEDVKADLIHFDNTCNQVRSPNMFHPLAKEEFRQFLRAKYDDEGRKERLGFADVRYVEPPMFLDVFAPPVYMVAPEPMNDPMYQEWLDFRCQKLADHYAELADYVKGLNPDVAIECNPHGVTGYVNKTFYEGVDWPRLLANTNFFWSEHEREAGVSEDGILTSKIRTYKVARTLNNMVFSGGGGLAQAEAMAFNQQCVTGGGALARFYTDHFEHYDHTESVADVAILRNYASIAHCATEARYRTVLFEQFLIQSKIPFDIIFNNNLTDLSKYSVLVLADQESLSDEEMKYIRDFVQNGGGLVATGETSLYTEWRRERRALGLADLFGFDHPSEALEPVRREVGRGRVVYLSDVEPSVDPSVLQPRWTEYWKFPLEYWSMPANKAELEDALAWAAGGRLSLEVDAPETVLAELLAQEQKGKLVLHLINYNVEREPLLQDLAVSMRQPKAQTLKQIRVYTPDGEEVAEPGFELEDGYVKFIVPTLKMYDLVVLEFSHANPASG